MIENHFPTTIYYHDNVVDKNSLEQYKTECLNIMQNIQDDPHPFGESSLKTTFWHKSYGHLHQLPQFQSLSHIIKEHALFFINVLGYPGIHPTQIKFTNMWVNLIEKNDYHALHVHNTIGSSLISGVFYVDAPLGASLNIGSPFRDSYVPVKPWQDNDLNHNLVEYECLPGRIIMFKSNVYHGYDNHKQEHQKISVPFNLALNTVEK